MENKYVTAILINELSLNISDPYIKEITEKSKSKEKENINLIVDLIYEKINDRLTNEMSPQFKEIFEQVKIK